MCRPFNRWQGIAALVVGMSEVEATLVRLQKTQDVTAGVPYATWYNSGSLIYSSRTDPLKSVCYDVTPNNITTKIHFSW